LAPNYAKTGPMYLCNLCNLCNLWPKNHGRGVLLRLRYAVFFASLRLTEWFVG